MARTLEDHLFGAGSKRLLALDGGGIRGVVTLEMLAKIERIVGEPLSEYFDLIGGTSTGAIIAAGLAHGWPVQRIQKLYAKLGKNIFKPSAFRKGLLRPKFKVKALEKALEREFRDHCLGGEEIQTGLAIMSKRLDTGSPWILHNNPKGKYYGPSPNSTAIPNRDYLVRQIVRASAAAPSFFEPEAVQVARDVTGAFVDGGVSPHNNPALQLLLLATLEGYGLQWPLGADRMLIVSLGTGSWDTRHDTAALMDMKPAQHAILSLLSLMEDASALNETLLQWLSRSPTARTIDSEIGTLDNDVLGGGDPWISYLRYDARIEREWLHTHVLGQQFTEGDIQSLREMDKPENMDMLATIGEAAARQIQPAHFL